MYHLYRCAVIRSTIVASPATLSETSYLGGYGNADVRTMVNSVYLDYNKYHLYRFVPDDFKEWLQVQVDMYGNKGHLTSTVIVPWGVSTLRITALVGTPVAPVAIYPLDLETRVVMFNTNPLLLRDYYNQMYGYDTGIIVIPETKATAFTVLGDFDESIKLSRAQPVVLQEEFEEVSL